MPTPTSDARSCQRGDPRSAGGSSLGARLRVAGPRRLHLLVVLRPQDLTRNGTYRTVAARLQSRRAGPGCDRIHHSRDSLRADSISFATVAERSVKESST